MRCSDVVLYLNADEVDSDEIVVAGVVDAVLVQDSDAIRYDSCWNFEFVDSESGERRPLDDEMAAIFHAYNDGYSQAHEELPALDLSRKCHHSFDILNTDPCHCCYSN